MSLQHARKVTLAFIEAPVLKRFLEVCMILYKTLFLYKHFNVGYIGMLVLFNKIMQVEILRMLIKLCCNHSSCTKLQSTTQVSLRIFEYVVFDRSGIGISVSLI